MKKQLADVAGPMGPGLNLGQLRALLLLLIGAALAAMILVLPYYNDGGLFGGTEYYRIGHAPEDPYISFSAWLFGWEISYIVLTSCAALAALRQRSPGLQRTCLFSGAALQTLFFLWSVRGWTVILGPEFTWYGMNVLAVITLVFVLGSG